MLSLLFGVRKLACALCRGSRNTNVYKAAASCRTPNSRGKAPTGRVSRPVHTKVKLLLKAAVAVLCLLIVQGFLAKTAVAQQRPEAQTGYADKIKWFPQVYNPYREHKIPDIQLADSYDLLHLIDAGKMSLSLSRLKAAVIENNLDILSADVSSRYAETDRLRVLGGGAPRGGAGVQIPSSLFSGAIGAGLGGSATLGSFGSVGGISGGGRQVRAFPRGSYDPSFALGFSIDSTNSPLNSQAVSGVRDVLNKSVALQTRYSQSFPVGASVSISFNSMRQSSTQKRLRYNPYVVSQFSIVLTQQLLNGFGSDSGRRFMEVAKNEDAIVRETVRLQVNTTLAKSQNSYWDLVASRENVRVAEQSVEVARRLLEGNRERAEIGTISDLDVVAAESELAARQRDLVQAQTALQIREVDLRSAISRDVSAVSAVRIEPTDRLPEPSDRDIPKLSDALESAMKNRPEIRRAAVNMNNQDIAIRYAKNQLKPSLMVFAMFTSSGLYGNRFREDTSEVLTGGLSQAIRQVRDWSYPDYAVGFSFSVSIRNQAAKADSIRAKLEKRRSEAALQRTRNAIALEVRKAVIGLVQSKAQVEAAHSAVELSGLTLEAEEARLAEGMSIPYDVIRHQRDYQSAQFAEVQARSNYAKALVELERSTGVLEPPQ